MPCRFWDSHIEPIHISRVTSLLNFYLHSIKNELLWIGEIFFINIILKVLKLERHEDVSRESCIMEVKFFISYEFITNIDLRLINKTNFLSYLIKFIPFLHVKKIEHNFLIEVGLYSFFEVYFWLRLFNQLISQRALKIDWVFEPEQIW